MRWSRVLLQLLRDSTLPVQSYRWRPFGCSLAYRTLRCIARARGNLYFRILVGSFPCLLLLRGAEGRTLVHNKCDNKCMIMQRNAFRCCTLNTILMHNSYGSILKLAICMQTPSDFIVTLLDEDGILRLRRVYSAEYYAHGRATKYQHSPKM